MMRTAIFAATAQGAQLAQRIRLLLDGTVQVFAKEGKTAGTGCKPYGRLADAVEESFSHVDALVFVMAAGIAVRMIAPHITSKLWDPAVVVVDERGQHAISLLSGHVGGANALAQEIAKGIGADPVITTATDVHGLVAVDTIASRLALRPCPKEQIKVLNSGMLEHRPVRYFVDEALANRAFYVDALRGQGISCATALPEALPTEGLAAYISARHIAGRDGLLFLQPRRLIAGVGCRKGTPIRLVRAALDEACRRIGRTPGDVSMLASTTAKREEKALLELSEEMGKEIRFFGNTEMQEKIEEYGLEESAFVKKTIGIGNVAEAAALCCVAGGRMALPKTKFEKVTVALLWEK